MNNTFHLQVDHIEVFVPSRFEAADWYRRTLGLHTVEELLEWAGDPDGPLMIAAAGGGPKLALFTGKPQSQRTVGGIHRIAFGVDGAGFLTFLESLVDNPVFDATGAPTSEPRIIDHNQAVSAYFYDPYGTPLEVTTYQPDAVRIRLGISTESADLQ